MHGLLNIIIPSNNIFIIIIIYSYSFYSFFLPVWHHTIDTGVGYLGGSEKVDVNNANVRVYAKFPGMYPTVAGKIVSHGPYKSVGDLYSISGLTGKSVSTIESSVAFSLV